MGEVAFEDFIVCALLIRWMPLAYRPFREVVSADFLYTFTNTVFLNLMIGQCEK